MTHQKSWDLIVWGKSRNFLLHCGKLLLKTEIAPENFPNQLSTQRLSARSTPKSLGFAVIKQPTAPFIEGMKNHVAKEGGLTLASGGCRVGS